MVTRLPALGRVVAVAAGGALGAGARYGIGLSVPAAGGRFPWPTFLVNVTGAFLLGVALTAFVERWPASRYRVSFLCTGVLGAAAAALGLVLAGV